MIDLDSQKNFKHLLFESLYFSLGEYAMEKI